MLIVFYIEINYNYYQVSHACSYSHIRKNFPLSLSLEIKKKEELIAHEKNAWVTHIEVIIIILYTYLNVIIFNLNTK